MTIKDTEISQVHLCPNLATSWLETARRYDLPTEEVANIEIKDRCAEPRWPRVFPGL